MISQQRGKDWLAQIIGQNQTAIAAAESDEMSALRNTSLARLADINLPDRKQESWRYTDLSRLYSKTYLGQTAPFTALDEFDIDDWIYADNESHRLVFVNGHWVSDLSESLFNDDSLFVGSLQQAIQLNPELVRKQLHSEPAGFDDIFSHLNTAYLNDGLFIHVPANTSLKKPIEVVYANLNLEANTLSQPRCFISLDNNAELKLIERHISTGDTDYFFNGVWDIRLAGHARLQHYRIQNESRNAHHLGRVSVTLAADSDYRCMNTAMGAAWSRTDLLCRFNGEHANCELQGLYLVGDAQYNDIHLDVRHRVPNCRSRENFRGILHGKGRAVFDGKVIVAKDAQKSDAQLSNKNLLLVPDAEIDTKPQLEIYADDVICSHGTAVGQLDPNQLYYLRSRGIAEQQARRMLCLGFAEQLLNAIDDKPLRTHIHDHIVQTLEDEVAHT